MGALGGTRTMSLEDEIKQALWRETASDPKALEALT
jgi:hypothetical protein